MSLELLVQQYGYWALFIGTLLEGEMVLVIAGFAAYRGYLALPSVMAVAFLGTLLGDQLAFFIGRKYGSKLLAKHPAWQARAERVRLKLERHQIAVLLGFRFLYGFRNIIPFVIGWSGFGRLRFAVLNVIGACVWSVIVSCLGYSFGHIAQAVLKDVRRYEVWIIIMLCGVGLAIWGRWLYRRYRTVDGGSPPAS